MDIAVVTGASSGLGLAISRRLIDLGFRVYGLGGNYTESTLSNVDFRPMPCDLADPAHVEAKIKEILEQERAITVLVNNAKYYPPDDFARGAPVEFSRSLNINLLCPLILARWCMDGLRNTRGCIINISAATPETSRGGPVGACAAGGLRWMQESLFQQLREDGVAVSTIHPEPNRWRPQDAPPPNGDRPQSVIDPVAVAEAVASILHHGRSNVITEVVIRPERLAERIIPPVRELPYPKPKPIPYTVPREQIEAEERADREEEERELNLTTEGDAKKKKRRRRGRGKKRPGEVSSDQNGVSEKDRGRKEGTRHHSHPDLDRPDRTEVKMAPTAESVSGQKKSRRRKGRKPRPPGMSADGNGKTLEPRPGPLAKESSQETHPATVKSSQSAALEKSQVEKSKPSEIKAEPKKDASEDSAKAQEAVVQASKPAKKAVRKAAKKAAVKKTAAKKAAAKKAVVKKVAVKKSAVKKTVGKKTARKLVKKNSTDAVEKS